MWQLFKIIFVNFGCFLKDCKTDSRKITCLNETQRQCDNLKLLFGTVYCLVDIN